MVCVAAVALGSSTYAWYITNNTVDATGKYTLKNQKGDFYAYTVSKYTLYAVNNTGLADVCLDNSTASGPVTITPSDDTTYGFSFSLFSIQDSENSLLFTG